MPAPTVGLFDIIVVLIYLGATAYLGWLGYRETKSSSDYLVAGRKVHPFIMALSYGATFISTSAIVGFGGVAGMFGMSLLWLTFCNIFIGIFIAFVFLGGPTRRMGHALDAHTFPELLGRRYQSRLIQVLAGLLIVCFMPLYGSAVLIGGTEFISTAFAVDFNVALFVFAVLVGGYVLFGGLKAVMYTDALQGAIMFVGMLILLGYTYTKVGGVVPGHRALTEMADLVPPSLQAIGHQGWTAMPKFGFGETQYNLWWIVVSTIVMGVGIGVLAQPQLVVRFMTVRSKRELNRAVGVGGVFILAMTGVAFLTGALSNAYFALHGPIFTGRVIKTVNPEKAHVFLQLMRTNEAGIWLDLVDEKAADGKTVVQTIARPPVKDTAGQWVPVARATNELGGILEGKVIPAVLNVSTSPAAAVAEGPVVVQGRTISVVIARGNDAQIIPGYITAALPKWFGLVFMLTLLSAAMSTLSSQYHTLGTAAGRDVFETLRGPRSGASSGGTVLIVRIAIVIGLIVGVTISYRARGDAIIARATAIFFGLCASSFLPAFLGGLFWRRMTRAGALASMLVGFLVTAFWLAFVKVPEVSAIGLVKQSLLAGQPNWPVVDPLLVALPLSLLTAVLVSLVTRPPEAAHLARCFAEPPGRNSAP
ncbi:MAG: sodium:solute symporter family protein [Limisphaerales bacterium]